MLRLCAVSLYNNIITIYSLRIIIGIYMQCSMFLDRKLEKKLTLDCMYYVKIITYQLGGERHGKHYTVLQSS